ncbi:peroxisome biogenesis protein 3-2 isoform X1 [Arachis hypogaea]|uniref:peroxisome biogenesis protein 3-2 isoform X1 n=1 Tax=Arachis hypogaea TaxID=3818 RepID=UPI000DECB453|nr:peroxisome biogenesis protein 3-2 isoform X3 [Arachis hypogaea]
MLSVRDLWRRHRRKVFISVGVLGSGYLLYKLYGAHRRRLDALERELAIQRESEELMKVQMQAHFENIQTISDVMTLPHAMHNLSCRVAEELDLSQLLERLLQGKGQPNTLTQSEKLNLWERLKILSFTRMALSVWATTMLSLYTKVQVNILGRHLYIDTARRFESSSTTKEFKGNQISRFIGPLLNGVQVTAQIPEKGGTFVTNRERESGDLVDKEDQQKFLGTVDFLCQHGMPPLISDMEAATQEALKGKQLSHFFNSTALHETIMQILIIFMSQGSPHSWIKYVMPEDSATSRIDDPAPSDVTEFEQLMMEARAVLLSAEFGSIIEICMKVVVNEVVEQMGAKFRGGSIATGLPLARVLPQVAQMCPLLLEEPSKNQFIRIIKCIPEVEPFFTRLYANMPSAY